jgi:hypothetical protein
VKGTAKIYNSSVSNVACEKVELKIKKEKGIAKIAEAGEAWREWDLRGR